MDNLDCSNFDNDQARRESAPDILHRLYHMLIDRCQKASTWYMESKDRDRKRSRLLRHGAVVFSTLALLVPVLIAIGQDSVQSNTSEQIEETVQVAIERLMASGAVNSTTNSTTPRSVDTTEGTPASTDTGEVSGVQGGSAEQRGGSSTPTPAQSGDRGSGRSSFMHFLADLSQVWALFLAAIAAAFIGLDRLMGYSTGWVRNVRAGLDLQHRREQFVLEWWALQTYYPLGGPSADDDFSDDDGDPFRPFSEGLLDSPPSGPPGPLKKDQNKEYIQILEKYVDALWKFDKDVRKIMEEETDQWIQEFQSNLQALRSRISQQTDGSGAPTSALPEKSRKPKADDELT